MSKLKDQEKESVSFLAIHKKQEIEKKEIQKKEPEPPAIEKEPKEPEVKLEGQKKEKYKLAKSMGLEVQAEIVRMEGLTSTKKIDYEAHKESLWRKIKKDVTMVIGPKVYSDDIEIDSISYKDTNRKIPLEALQIIKKLDPHFDSIYLMFNKYSSRVYLCGYKKFGEIHLNFKITEWQ